MCIMNILKIEQKFRELEHKERLVQCTYNPRIKTIPGAKRHRFITDLSYDMAADYQLYGFDPYFTSMFNYSLNRSDPSEESRPISSFPQPPPDSASAPLLPRPPQRMSKVSLQSRRVANQGALRELRFHTKPIPTLKNERKGPKPKTPLSAQKVKEQYDWLHGVLPAPTANVVLQSMARVLTIDRTSIAGAEGPDRRGSHDLALLESKGGPSLSGPQERENEDVTFLLQFKSRGVRNGNST